MKCTADVVFIGCKARTFPLRTAGGSSTMNCVTLFEKGLGSTFDVWVALDSPVSERVLAAQTGETLCGEFEVRFRSSGGGFRLVCLSLV